MVVYKIFLVQYLHIIIQKQMVINNKQLVQHVQMEKILYNKQQKVHKLPILYQIQIFLFIKVQIYLNIFRTNQSLLLRKDFPKTYNQPNYQQIEHKLYNQVNLYEKYNKLIQKQKAVTFIIQSCHKYKQQLGIICFGPTTNLGLAHRLQSCLGQVKMISLTGGQYMGMGNTVVGNIQANFAYDPLATHILLQQKSGEGLKDKIYINVFQKSCDFNFKNIIQKCLNYQNLDKHIKLILQYMLEHNINDTINCAPILTIVPFLQSKSVKNKHYVYAQIVRDNGQVDGLLAINWLKVGAKPGQFVNFLYLYEDYDQEIIQNIFYDTITKNKQGIIHNGQ